MRVALSCYNRRMADTSLTDPGTLPHWDVSAVFPSLESRELAVAHEGVVADLARLVALYDRHDVRDGEPREGGPTAGRRRRLRRGAGRDEPAARPGAPGVGVPLHVHQHRRLERHRGRAPVAAAGRADRPDPAHQAVRGLDRPGSGVAELVAASEDAADHAYPLERAAERGRSTR